MDEILPVVTFGPVEQRAEKENETYFLSECSCRQVLTNTDLYFSKGRENQELLKYFKNNTACLSTAKPLQKQSTLGTVSFTALCSWKDTTRQSSSTNIGMVT